MVCLGTAPGPVCQGEVGKEEGEIRRGQDRSDHLGLQDTVTI